jgi:APA family basic amino acid/polyamine antiporter
LRRHIGLYYATSIVIANMVGTGIFTSTGVIANYVSSPIWIMSAWVLGGLIALTGALSYAELATRMPEVGGEYIYLKKVYHPLVAFLSGWTSFFVGFSAPIAAAAISFAAYFLAGIEGIWLTAGIDGSWLSALIAITAIVVFTTIHIAGVQLGGYVQNILTALKVLIVTGISILGLIYGDSQSTSYHPEVMEAIPIDNWGSAILLVLFSYSGWNASTYIAGEITRPQRNIPLSLIVGTLSVVTLYILVNLYLLETVPLAEMRGEIAVVEMAASNTFGTAMGDVFGLLVSIALLSTLSALIIIGPRVYYAMAKDSLFLQPASVISSRASVPVFAIALQGVVAIAMVVLGTFEQLLVYMGFALNIFPWLAVVGLFIARRRGIGDNSAIKSWGYPFLPLFYLVASAMVMFIAFLNHPVESVVALVTVLAAIPVYYLQLRANKQKRQHGSVRDRDADSKTSGD